MELALQKDKQNMGKRYIEVFRSKKSEMDWVVKRSGPDQMNNSDAVVRLRGLPFGCSKEEIAHFFTGMEIVPNGISLLQDHQGRTTGDAFVQFASQDIAEGAIRKHKEKIGHRYIEIFKSSMAELRGSSAYRGGRGGMAGGGAGGGMGRPGPYDRGDRFGAGVGGPPAGGVGMGGYGRGRGRGNIKGIFDDDHGYDDFGPASGFGGSGFGGGRRAGMGGRGGMGMGGMGMGDSMGGGRGRFGGGASGGMGGRGGGMSAGYGYESQTGHAIHMRGLPFAAQESDIAEFFKPAVPLNIVIHYNNDGRASGEADVDFSSHDEAQQAMTKDKQSMKHRYIELFLRSTPGGRASSIGSTGGAGGGGGGYASNMGANRGNYGAGDNFGNAGGYGGNMGGGFSDAGNFGGGYGNGPGMGGGMGGGGGYANNNMNMGTNNMAGPNYTAF